MREHSEAELETKLRTRGFERQAVTELVRELRSQALLCDARFAQAYTSSRVAKGYGPAAVRQALRARGVSEEVISGCIDGKSTEWEARLRSARDKRFGPDAPTSATECARQARFLSRRGFTTEQIRRALSARHEPMVPVQESRE